MGSRSLSREKATGISAGIASAVFLGLAPVFGKQALLSGFSPLAVVAIRTGLAALLLLLPMLIFRRKFFYIYPVGLVGCLLAGFTNGIGSILYYAALARLDTSIGQLLYSFYPLFVAFWLLMDRQPLSRVTILRLALALPGTYLLLAASHNHIDLMGAFMMVLAAILYALHLLINQRVLYEVPAPTVTFYTLLSMAITVIAFYLLFDRSVPETGTPWWPVLAMALITFLSRISLFLGVKHLGSLQTSLLGLGEILITIILAVIFLGDRLSLLQCLGGLMLLLSMLLVNFDTPTMEKRRGKGILSWLAPPRVDPAEYPWQ